MVPQALIQSQMRKIPFSTSINHLVSIIQCVIAMSDIDSSVEDMVEDLSLSQEKECNSDTTDLEVTRHCLNVEVQFWLL